MDKFLFPINYKYSPKFLGIIEYKVLLPICIIACVIIFFLYMLKVDFFLGFGIVLLFVMPSTMLLSVGVKGQPAVQYFMAVIKFRHSKKLYIYKKS